MTAATSPPAPAPDSSVPMSRRRWLWGSLAGLAGLLVVLVLLVVFFPWDSLRGPLNRFVSEKTGRQFEITRRLDVKLGMTTRVIADGIEFANPSWARSPHLVKAEGAEIDIRLWPLLTGQVELPLVRLQKPVLGLQLEADGRRTWALGQDTSDKSTVPKIGALLVDSGVLNYVDTAQGADITTEFALESETDAAGNAVALPLSFKGKGSWKREPFTAQGRTSGVLQLSEATAQPFALQISAAAGRTSVVGTATIGQLATFDNTQATFDVKGRSLSDLYKLLGVVLPSTPPYALRGQLDKQGAVWKVSQMQGRLGKSDLAGELSFDRSAAVPLLSGKVRSKSLDFRDLGPIIGAAPAGTAAPAVVAAAQRPGKVLPNTPLAFDQLKVMNADVQYDIAEIRHVEAIPLDRAKVHIQLKDGLLQLDPLDLGVAGGTVTGSVKIDANTTPTVIATKLEARGLQLNQLFPKVELTKGGLGKFTGKVDLQGRGNSVAQVLGSSSGNMAMLTGRGEISNILLEFLGLDGGEIIKFFLGGDRNVRMRCAAAAFDVKDGLMTSRTIVLDTSDTVIVGSGQISLANETLNLRLEPAPKDRSILSLRSPIKVGGTFAAPTGGPEAGALALRAGAALALGAINPFLALAATFETGPGEDANCVQVLAKAGTPLQRSRATGTGQRPQAAPAPKK